jgi:hypothetical protein
MTPQDTLGEVDRVLRWLDLPFDMNKWTELYATHKDHTFSAYFNLLYDDHYQALQWADENERWHLAQKEGTIDDEIKAISTAQMKRLKKVWGPTYDSTELLWLEDFYNKIVATQNVSTPIL